MFYENQLIYIEYIKEAKNNLEIHFYEDEDLIYQYFGEGNWKPNPESWNLEKSN